VPRRRYVTRGYPRGVSVDQITSAVPFVLTLAEPAEVNSGGEVVLGPENLTAAAPEAPVQSVFGRDGIVVAATNDYLASQVRNDSDVDGAQVSDALEVLDAAVAAAGVVWLAVYVADIVAPGSVFVPAPVTGTLTTIRLALSAQPDINYAVVAQIGGAPVTGGMVTVQSTDEPGTVRSATPSAANAVTAGTSSVELVLPDLQGTPGNGVALLGFTPA